MSPRDAPMGTALPEPGRDPDGRELPTGSDASHRVPTPGSTPSVLHRVSLIGFGTFERKTFDLFFRMAEQRSRRPQVPGAAHSHRDRGYLQVAPQQHPEVVLINGDVPDAVEQAWRWPGRCVCIGGQPFSGAIGHLARPVHMHALLGLLDDLTQGGRNAWLRAPAPATGSRPDISERLLVVDDNEHTLRSMSRFLRKHGWAATYARSGEEALYRVAQGRFECVLLDARMDGISGWITARLIKTRPYAVGRPVPHVVVMARPEGMLDPLRVLLSRCDARIYKPLRKQDLVTQLTRWLGEHPRRSGPPPTPASEPVVTTFPTPLRDTDAAVPRPGHPA